MNTPYLSIGQEVTYIAQDKKTHKAKIRQVFSQDEATVEWEGGAAVTKFSEDKEPGTFHFEQASPKEEHKNREAHNQHKKE